MNSVNNWKNKGITKEMNYSEIQKDIKEDFSEFSGWSRCFHLLLAYEGQEEGSPLFGTERLKWMSKLNKHVIWHKNFKIISKL